MAEGEQELTSQGEFISVDEPKVVSKSKKRKHEVTTHTTPIERPRRQARPVVPYGSQIPETKSRMKKPIEVGQGEGIPLGQIPPIVRAIDKLKTTDDIIKGLHKLLYGRIGTKHDIKSHIRAFSGFVVGTPVDEMVFKEKLEKWKIAGLKEICSLFNLKSSGDKASIVERLFEFLKKPYDTSTDKERKLNKKPTAKTTKRSVSTKKKTPRDIYFVKQREIFEAKDDNESATRQEIQKQMSEAWNELSEKEKKPYISLAENANKSIEVSTASSNTITSKKEDNEEKEIKKSKKSQSTKKNDNAEPKKKRVSRTKIKSPEIVHSEDELEDEGEINEAVKKPNEEKSTNEDSKNLEEGSESDELT
ncbi:6619_t:CDS:2 [Diversispora eburnea]|uniref:6619_t:CDS:1 n=1 Tax=Diversispora eburnea TaxID=1213867 RepID=A0A9N9BV64_9GLOM|nr:6619_t:CDS:2 [Diversispora eburnea]